MKKSLIKYYLLAFIIIWSLVGFPFVATLTSFFGINSTPVSFTFRSLAILASVAVLLLSKKPFPKLAVILFLAFWIAYFLRLIISFYILEDFVRLSAETYWMWAVGGCFLPGLAVLLGYDSSSLQNLRHFLIILILFTLLLAITQGDTDHLRSDGSSTDINRWNLETLNPISMGHLGVTAVLVGLANLGTRTQTKSVFLLMIAITITGSILALYANSRGPLLALAVGISIFLIARLRKKKTIFVVFGIAALAAFTSLTQNEVLFRGAGVIYRFSAVLQGNDLSTIGRLNTINGAFNQFLASPIFGDALEERTTQFYPHNVIAEAFMATGLVGGLPFVFLLCIALHAAWVLVRRGSEDAWVGLVLVQYLVGAQFSGAIYNVTTMWVMLSLTIAASHFLIKGSPIKVLSSGRHLKKN